MSGRSEIASAVIAGVLLTAGGNAVQSAPINASYLAPGAAPADPSASDAVEVESNPGPVSGAFAVSPVSAQIEHAVEERLRGNLTPEMFEHFGLFIYVSKADIGPWAQRMLVFQKAGDELLPLYNWPVSTGRETIEADAQGVELPTGTPDGYFELDPKRFYEDYRSVQWDEPMPYAMFFNWIDHGAQTGFAIHAASGDGIGRLGMRASAGCVRLAPDNARTLFTLVRDNYRGMAPKFGFDKYTSTLMNNGLLVHDPEGNVELSPGYSVLVFIDGFGGERLEANAY